MAGLFEMVGADVAGGGGGGIGEFLNTLNPLKWAQDQFNLGQARDEARGVRAGDIERDEKWLERNSISGRIKEGMANGLSRSAAAGLQPMPGTAATVGQDNGYTHLAQSQSINPLASLEKKLLESQIRSVDLDNLRKEQELEPPDKPGRPIVGDGFLPGSSQVIKGGKRINEKPMERTTSNPLAPYSEPGAITGLGWEVTPTGLAPVPSADAKERIEDSPYELRHFLNYGLFPDVESLKKSLPPPRAGYHWGWDPVKMEMQEFKSTLPTTEEWKKMKFKKYKLRKVKNENPFYGGTTIEGYFGEY